MKHNFLRTLPKLFLIWLLIAVQACDNDTTPEIPFGSDGYFVVNEGAFGKSNTSISFYNRAKQEVTNDVFTAKNGRALGDQAQSMTVFENKGYIAVQNSSKVEVIDAENFASIKTITEGIESPRFFLGISSTKGYVSDWGHDGETGTIRVVDLGTLTVTDTIAVGKGTNKMVLRNGKVYVANAGGWGYDNTIAIIDVSTDEVTSTIEVGDNPTQLVFDKDGNLWASGSGNFFDTNPWISKIGTDNKVVFQVDLPVMTYSSPALVMNNAGDEFYYNYNDAVYRMSVNASVTPENKFIDKSAYGLAVDPITGDIIVAEAIGFSGAGKVHVYNPAGTLQKSYDVGIAPNGIAFK